MSSCVGRFAPTPSGMHLATFSRLLWLGPVFVSKWQPYSSRRRLDIRAHNLTHLLLLDDLQWLGLTWDKAVLPK